VTNSNLNRNLDKQIASSHKRRRVLQVAAISATAPVWHKPLINAIALPAHAQTSAVASEIVVSSLDGDNPFSRFVLIVDQNDTVLANCGASGGRASATNLDAGTYRVFADSDGPQNQIIDISTDNASTRVTVPTDTGACDFLVATIELPSGQITPQSGQRVSGSWSCASNLNTGCN